MLQVALCFIRCILISDKIDFDFERKSDIFDSGRHNTYDDYDSSQLASRRKEEYRNYQPDDGGNPDNIVDEQQPPTQQSNGFMDFHFPSNSQEEPSSSVSLSTSKGLDQELDISSAFDVDPLERLHAIARGEAPTHASGDNNDGKQNSYTSRYKENNLLEDLKYNRDPQKITLPSLGQTSNNNSTDEIESTRFGRRRRIRRPSWKSSMNKRQHNSRRDLIKVNRKKRRRQSIHKQIETDYDRHSETFRHPIKETFRTDHHQINTNQEQSLGAYGDPSVSFRRDRYKLDIDNDRAVVDPYERKDDEYQDYHQVDYHGAGGGHGDYDHDHEEGKELSYSIFIGCSSHIKCVDLW